MTKTPPLTKTAPETQFEITVQDTVTYRKVYTLAEIAKITTLAETPEITGPGASEWFGMTREEIVSFLTTDGDEDLDEDIRETDVIEEGTRVVWHIRVLESDSEASQQRVLGEHPVEKFQQVHATLGHEVPGER